MNWLTRLIVTLLRYSEPMVPAEQRAWARALRTEAGQIPAGWERLAWLFHAAELPAARTPVAVLSGGNIDSGLLARVLATN